MEGACGGAWVDKEFVHVLEGIEAVGAAPAEDVDVEAVSLGEEQVRFRGDEGEALEEADADAAVDDDLGDGQGGGLDVVAALDNLEVRRDGAQVLVRVLVGEVAEAERLGDLSRSEELLELWSERAGARKALDALRDCVDGEVMERGLLTLAGMSSARSGMCMSPITRMRNAMVPHRRQEGARRGRAGGIGGWMM